MDVLHWLISNHEAATRGLGPAIIPTVLIPLTALTVGLSSLAGLIAGWFGIKLNTEGPKQFLEVLLKKRVIFSMIAMNLLGLSLYKSYNYVKTSPSFLITVRWEANKNKAASSDHYDDALTRNHDFVGDIIKAQPVNLNLIKEIKLPEGSFRSGAPSAQSLFFGSDDGHIYEIAQNSLAIKRKFYIGDNATTRPVIFNQRLYSGEGSHLTHHARVYSFDLKTGAFIKAFPTKGHTEGQQLITSFDNRTYMLAAAGSDGLYAIDPLTMQEIWHTNDGHLDATPSVEGNTVYIGTGVEKAKLADRSYAVARELKTSKMIWKKELPLSNWMHPIVAKNDVCYVLGEIYIPSTVGLLYCLNKKTGEPHFSIPFNAPIASLPYYIFNQADQDEFIFLATMNGEVCGVNLVKKEKAWCKITVKDPAKNENLYALASLEYDSQRGILWYPSPDNGLFGFSLLDGKTLARWSPNKNETPWSEHYAAVNVIGDKLYHMDINGHLRMIQLSPREEHAGALAEK